MTTGFPNGILMSPAFLGIILAQVTVWNLEKESHNIRATYIPDVRVAAEVMAGPVPISEEHFPTHGL